MFTLSCLEWILTSGGILTYCFLLLFVFGLFFKVIRG